MAFAPQRGVPSSIVFQGKEVNLWTWGQLERLNKEKLRARALNLRDAIGADRVPNPPHHEEAIRLWILQTQCALTDCSMADFGQPQTNAQGMPLSRATSEAMAGDTGDDDRGPAQRSYMDAQKASQIARERNRGSADLLSGGGGYSDTDSGRAYSEARQASQMARDRNRGSSNFLSWA